MQPCSQPRYGFKLVSKPTSGLLLRVMIDFVPSRKYWVACCGRSSSLGSISTTSLSVRSTWSLSKRLAGLPGCAPSMDRGEGLRRLLYHWDELLLCFVTLRRHGVISSHERIHL